MIKRFKSVVLVLAAMFCAFNAQADEPILTFHTNIYDLFGGTNTFTFYLGATEAGTYVDVDYGYGPVEVEVGLADFDSYTGGLTGTAITCSVGPDATVRVYGDASKIDFLDCEGNYISDIDLSKLTELRIINLKHNELKALDLTPQTKLEAIYLTDNLDLVSPLKIGAPKPDLAILEMSILGKLDQSFSLRDYPKMASFECWGTHDLKVLDPTNCPDLLRISVDVTNIDKIDVSKNPKLLILNVSNTKVTSLDVSQNPYLTELYMSHTGQFNNEYKFTSIDVTNNPYLARFYCDGNKISEIDITKNPALVNFSIKDNEIRSIDISNNTKLATLDISDNRLDFSTIPADPGYLTEYFYSQKPFEMDRSYAKGTVLDFSKRVLREDGDTYCALLAVSEADPENHIELDETHMTFDRGLVTLNEVYADSVYVAFYNTALPDYDLKTTRFAVKDINDMGKPSLASRLRFYPTTKDIKLFVGVGGATTTKPREFVVDLGDGTMQTFTATTSSMPASANATFTRLGTGPVDIYMPEGSDLTALGLANQRLLTADVSSSRSLEQLAITGCKLNTIDLQWNRCLRAIDLSGNSMTSISLTAPNGSYGKNVLNSINLSNNALTSVELPEMFPVLHLDLSNNKLSELTLGNTTNLINLDLSNNNLQEVDLSKCEALQNLDLSNNSFASLVMPADLWVNSVDISNNCFTLRDLIAPAGMPATIYTYAPQKPFVLPAKAPTVNLKANYLDDANGVTTYTWHLADGTVVGGSDITSTANGVFKFANPNLGLVYCSMSHPTFPQFADDKVLTTTQVETAPMPTRVFASFTTKNDGNAVINLASSVPNNTIYIDWDGKENLEQYVLQAGYQSFPAETFAGVKVRCFSYDDDEAVTVFSLNGAEVSDFDASAMKGVSTFTLSGAGLENLDNVKLPAAEAIKELNLSDNKLTEFDPSSYPNVVMLTVGNNKLKTIDLTSLKKLEGAYLAGNELESVKFDNPALWNLLLSENNLQTIDLTGLPKLQQMWVANNYLSDLDLTAVPELRVLFVEGNRFTFNTLPHPDRFAVYSYANQALVEAVHNDGVVDLSHHVTAHDTETKYTWFIDDPYIDEYGELAGENLYEEEEYTINGGVTTFIKPFTHIMCVMTNEALPNLYLCTNFLDVDAGVNDITVDTVDANAPVEYYDLQGRQVRADRLRPGIYIRRQGNTSIKVLIGADGTR